ncbi:VTT domain-containing protein [Dactylosporangium aurantiacum]|uniref:VTT domain-containing protein n=1 Tax=Dactylosporangium aurantiacum TaxID=35754 RepID=A0A9Q9ILE1_9ACTN|nr:VTT domain-containing protein [Dactylosporangium aurantiacum]MDG6105665.1 VTT domain-containing protein [Dactylosporangium aurantiacum]UWZ57003.1 VTT domain-containing protein [Dactylosporangium aurantiacum]
MTTFGALLAAIAGLFAVVAVGSTVPILPTGAAVSATAVVAAHRSPLALLAVVAAGAAGAYCGDAVTYAICRAGGEALTRRLRLLRQPLQLAEAVQRRLTARPVSALLVSRLVPGGRIPVLLTAAIVGLSWRRFATANVAACALWSSTYAAIGLLGRSVFPQPWQGVVAALVIALGATQLASWLRHRRERRDRRATGHAPSETA